MSNKYRVFGCFGENHGEWEGSSPEEALEAYLRHAYRCEVRLEGDEVVFPEDPDGAMEGTCSRSSFLVVDEHDIPDVFQSCPMIEDFWASLSAEKKEKLDRCSFAGGFFGKDWPTPYLFSRKDGELSLYEHEFYAWSKERRETAKGGV